MSSPLPKARYAHLSSVTGNCLFIIGGQDLQNVWLDDIYVYDLNLRTWVQKRDYPRHCGTYRSVAVSAEMRVRLPSEEMNKADMPTPVRSTFRNDLTPGTPTTPTPRDAFVHLPYSAPPTEEYPTDIYLYSNYNVRRTFVPY